MQIWRRSFDIPPPAMEKDHPYYDNIVNDPRYAGDPKPEEFPMFESLKLTIERTLPYWNNVIVPQVCSFYLLIILKKKMAKFVSLNVGFCSCPSQ